MRLFKFIIVALIVGLLVAFLTYLYLNRNEQKVPVTEDLEDRTAFLTLTPTTFSEEDFSPPTIDLSGAVISIGNVLPISDKPEEFNIETGRGGQETVLGYKFSYPFENSESLHNSLASLFSYFVGQEFEILAYDDLSQSNPLVFFETYEKLNIRCHIHAFENASERRSYLEVGCNSSS